MPGQWRYAEPHRRQCNAGGVANLRIIAIRHMGKNFMKTQLFGQLHGSIKVFRHEHSQVVEYRAFEQDRPLGQVSYLVRPTIKGEIRAILSVYKKRALGWEQPPHEHMQESTLSGPVATTNANDLTRTDRKIDIFG